MMNYVPCSCGCPDPHDGIKCHGPTEVVTEVSQHAFRVDVPVEVGVLVNLTTG